MTDLPSHGLQLISTLGKDGILVLELDNAPVTKPAAAEVVVKIEAAPINPSDLLTLMPQVDPSVAEFAGTADRPKVIAQLSAEATASMEGRFGQALTVGLEGAGTVIAAGDQVAEMLGNRVAALSLGRGFYGEYLTLPAGECVVLPDDVSTSEAGGLFTNPLTALAMAEVVKLDGYKGMIHTAAASNLGQMLVKICAEDGIPLINIVRRPEQAALLKSLGATYVCDSSQPDFPDELLRGVEETGTMLAFDALGGGDMAHQLLSAMESAASKRLRYYSPYGTAEFKQLYTYGLLDSHPMTLRHMDYGLLWGINGFLMPAVLERVGTERAAAMRQRVLKNIKTTFASNYSRQVSLSQVLDRDVMIGYHRQTTGGKVLINPRL